MQIGLTEILMLLLLPPAEQDAVIGDLAERYVKRRKKYGTRFAKIWFYRQVIASITPLLRRLIVKWGLFGWVVEIIRRFSA